MLRILAVIAVFTLTACGSDNVWASDDALLQARYIAPQPTTITLFTVINNGNDAGAHSALLVNGSEQVLFDPAGSMSLKTLPERHDVLYGATPRMVNAFIDYHVRKSYRMTIQTRQVSPEIAELILARVKANGSVAKAHCANSISKLLGDVPGFENISTTYFPKALAKDFASYPNVSLRTVTDANVDTSHGVIFIDPKDFDDAQAANAGL